MLSEQTALSEMYQQEIPINNQNNENNEIDATREIDVNHVNHVSNEMNAMLTYCQCSKESLLRGLSKAGSSPIFW